MAYEGSDNDLIEEITRVGLAHDLVTAYTSFVAVDRSREVQGEARTILQPVDTPEGVDARMAGAKVVGNQARMATRAQAGGGVLELLSKKGSSAAPGPAATVSSVSNLSAARVPSRRGFRVNGLVGKLPPNKLSVGGGGGVVTRGGAALLRGGGGGKLSGKRVGGLVQKSPRSMRSVGGTLSRDEIQKVINKNIAHIQRCYERELLKTPGLAGKLQIEWTIGEDGRVKRVRVRFSSLQNGALAACVVRLVRKWKFPQPVGGEVVVNYPFIFRSVGF